MVLAPSKPVKPYHGRLRSPRARFSPPLITTSRFCPPLVTEIRGFPESSLSFPRVDERQRRPRVRYRFCLRCKQTAGIPTASQVRILTVGDEWQVTDNHRPDLFHHVSKLKEAGELRIDRHVVIKRGQNCTCSMARHRL